MSEEQLKPEDDVKESDSMTARTRPAVFCDAFLLESDENLFRITFGEGSGSIRDRIRFAMVMPIEDVKELARMLTELLARMKAEESGKAKKSGL